MENIRLEYTKLCEECKKKDIIISTLTETLTTVINKNKTETINLKQTIYELKHEMNEGWKTINRGALNNNNQNNNIRDIRNTDLTLQNRFNVLTVDDCILDDNSTQEIDERYTYKDHQSNVIKHKEKSRVYVNKHPESNRLPLRNVAIPIDNSYTNYDANIRKERTIALLSASITKPIDMREFSNLINHGTAVKRAFGGATASQLNYYVQEVLHENKPDTIIINAGTNNFSKKRNQTAEETTSEILDIVQTCREGGINRILVSSITCRPHFQTKINEVNELLQYYSGIHNYEYIDNSRIREKHLKSDGVHLNKEGICILSNNFLAYLNSPSCYIPFEGIWD